MYVTKILINICHNFMKLIDAGLQKPAEVDQHVWDTLSAKRKSQKSKEKSEQMQAVSKRRGSKEA